MASMTPTGLISDVVVVLPSSDVELSAGLAIDIGCTNAKLVYRSNKEYRKGKPVKLQSDPTRGQVHYALFPREDIDSMINYVKTNADLTADETGDIVVNSAGVGGAGFKSEIERGLKCKLQVHSEFDCFIKAFLLMEKSISPDELFESIHPDLEGRLKEKVAPIRSLYEQFQLTSEMQVTPQSDTSDTRDARDDIKDTERPRILVMGGSGTGVIQINRDRTSRLMGLQTMSGSFMQGLAGFLTGEKDYTKLEQMAGSSDGKTTDTWNSDLKAKSSTMGNNIYDVATQLDKRTFLFGKGKKSNLEDVKREDLVHSAFTAAAMSNAQMVCYCAQLIGARDVFFCGNLFSSHIMKRLILEERLLNEIYTQTKAASYQFVKNGGMMGALGAFIHNNK